MRAIAKHHVQQDYRHLRILGLLMEPTDAQIVVHHGVQTAYGELILAQVNNGMLLAHHRILQDILPLLDRCIGVNKGQIVLQNEQCLIGQGASREEAPQIALALGKSFNSQVRSGVLIESPGSQLNGQSGRFVEGADEV